MDIHYMIDNVNSKEEFMDFLAELRCDREQRSREWQNRDIDSYLEGIYSWVDDMEGYFHNMNLEVPKDINWKFIATLFYVGKIYE